MKIHALKNLIVLAQSSSINEASHKLFVSQPSLSKSIHQMEEELGFPLFRRGNFGIELTSQGRIVLEGAKKIVDIYDSWMAISQQAPLHQLKVYTSVSFSDFLLPDTILKVKEKYPELHIVYRSVSAPEEFITPDIADPVLVMTVCDETMLKELTQVQCDPPRILMTGSYQCLVNRNNPLAKKSSVWLEDLKTQCLMLPTSATDLRDPNTFIGPLMSQITQAAPSNVLEVETLRNVIASVRGHNSVFAVSFYPPLHRYPGADEGELMHIPFSGTHGKGALCLFYSHPAAKKYSEVNDFVEILLQKAKSFLEEHHVEPEYFEL